jgi:hypothetical protein
MLLYSIVEVENDKKSTLYDIVLSKVIVSNTNECPQQYPPQNEIYIVCLHHQNCENVIKV